jgi:hypothetical protein
MALRSSTFGLVLLLASTGCGEGELAAGRDEDASPPAFVEDINPGLLGPWGDAGAEAQDDAASDPFPESDTGDELADKDASTEDASPTEPPPEDAAAPPPPPGPPADCVRARVRDTGGIGLNVRPEPSTAQPPLGNLPDGSVVNVHAHVQGESIEGNTTWFEVSRGDLRGFVTSVWAECLGPPGPTDDLFLLPFGCGESYGVTQGNNSAFSHNGRSAFAFDFSMGTGTPLRAMKGGTVSYAYAGTGPGHPCYNGGDRGCINDANYVVVGHADGSQTRYAHLSEVHVGTGDGVAQGQTVGLSGSTGWSTGPHAHVERQENCGRAFCSTIPMQFADVEGDGVPDTGDTVTSQNGCGP